MAKIKRRHFILGGTVAAGLTAYSAWRGMRLPPFIWEPASPPTSWRIDNLQLRGSAFIRTPGGTSSSITLRAYAPEPALSLKAEGDGQITITISNICPDATLNTRQTGALVIDEQTDGIHRQLTLAFQAGQTLNLDYQLDVSDGYQFAAIGDTGGQQELGWCLRRAHQLKALFLLHLGDFYYAPGDYQSTISQLNDAALPVYVTPGNHDFHDGETRVQQFLDQIGPLNSLFTLGNTRFAGIDTATGLVPWSRGQRGRLFQQLAAIRDESIHNVAFTHKPLFDPIETSSHQIGNRLERQWLIKSLRNSGFDTLLSGHLHIFDRQHIDGIDNIIVGQGLGHQDLITNQDYSKIALGEVTTDGAVNFEFPTLAMPWANHCHPRHQPVIDSLKSAPHADKITELVNRCS